MSGVFEKGAQEKIPEEQEESDDGMSSGILSIERYEVSDYTANNEPQRTDRKSVV